MQSTQLVPMTVGQQHDIVSKQIKTPEKLTIPQLKSLRTLVNAEHHEKCFMGGGKRAHVLSACRALVRRGLAMEVQNVYFIATDQGRETYALLTKADVAETPGNKIDVANRIPSEK